MVGKFATAKAGHDKRNLYVIVAEDEKSVYLSDGRLKPVEHPKKKNKKHIQIINARITDMKELQNAELPYKNEEIKRAIRLYRKIGDEK